ncbi:hypothetical protein [Cellulosimicrobium cellulans]|uniref:hypothetical protein n=1 Tax=Cellulosimicrobium cellulans TaxID=1710 RepID=UPI001BA7179F|nr:hypothetical protein [Cellulosimicrobium cellulans]QUB99080.1 hypothetical protein J5A69_15340 [Cellulosimicrobium cellulans]
MRVNRWAVLSAAVLSATAMGGCSAEGEAHAEQIETPQASTAAQQPSPVDPPEVDALDDAVICTAYGDVTTIAENADLALAEGRMEAQERDGWYRLATRVLDRLPSAGDSAVQTAIGELKEIAPVTSGAFGESTGVRSPEWNDVQGDLGDACDGLGAPLAITMFTGG